MANHICQALVVTCIDFRFQPYIDRWLAENFQPGTFDRVAMAGGIKDLDTILAQVSISAKLHNIKRTVLINHEDCGAYGQENFPDSSVEHEKHAEDLKNAASKIKQKYPELEVETYFLHLNGTFEEV